jgi:hypothetical protein
VGWGKFSNILQAGAEGFGVDAVDALKGDGDEPGVGVTRAGAFGHEVAQEALEVSPVADGQELGQDVRVWWVRVGDVAEFGHVAVYPVAGLGKGGFVEVAWPGGEDSIEN